MSRKKKGMARAMGLGIWAGFRRPLLGIFLGVLVVVRLGQRRRPHHAGAFVHLPPRQPPVVLAGGERELTLRVHLEGDHHPRLARLGGVHALDGPPPLAVQLLCGPARAAQHVDEDALVAVLDGGEALRGAGGDLAPLREELRRRPAGLLDRDGLAQRRRPRLLFARAAEDQERGALFHCRSASASPSPTMRAPPPPSEPSTT